MDQARNTFNSRISSNLHLNRPTDHLLTSKEVRQCFSVRQSAEGSNLKSPHPVAKLDRALARNSTSHRSIQSCSHLLRMQGSSHLWQLITRGVVMITQRTQLSKQGRSLKSSKHMTRASITSRMNGRTILTSLESVPWQPSVSATRSNVKLSQRAPKTHEQPINPQKSKTYNSL